MKKSESLDRIQKLLSKGFILLEQTRERYKSQLEAVERHLESQNDEPESSACAVEGIEDLNDRLSNFLCGHSNSNGPDNRSNNSNPELLKRIERLQEQNRMLTAEISRQSNRVTALEHDKRSLIKQLFQHTSSQSSNASSTLR